MEGGEDEIEDNDNNENDNEKGADNENSQSNSTDQVVVESNENTENIAKKQQTPGKVLRSSNRDKKRRFYNLYTSSPTRRLALPAASSSSKQKRKPEKVQKDNSNKNQNSEPTNSAAINSPANNKGNTFAAGDSFDNYGRYVSSELRSLKSRYAQEFTKLKIQQVLFEAHFMSGEQQDYDNVQLSMASSNNQPQVVILPTSLPNTSDDVYHDSAE